MSCFSDTLESYARCCWRAQTVSGITGEREEMKRLSEGQRSLEMRGQRVALAVEHIEEGQITFCKRTRQATLQSAEDERSGSLD